MRIGQANGMRAYVKPNRTQEDNMKLNYNERVLEILLDSCGSG